MTICEENKCTGCAACMNVCAHQAISMVEDKFGYQYPQINPTLCVECGLCQTICPSNHIAEKHQPLSTTIVTAKNELDKRPSTSSGLAHIIAREILLEGGVVYGCTCEFGVEVKHIRVEQESELNQLRGSKYVQSSIGSTYTNIRKDLLTGRKVLFIGTPCQNAGLINYLHRSYDNLLTIDFVCHGVPSQKMLLNYVSEVTSLKACQIAKISFRKKDTTGKSTYGIFVTNPKNQEIYHCTYPRDLYITAFLHGLTYRENCYQCLYTTNKRVSDITLGDYWDKENKYHLDELSMLIVNTTKGSILVDKIKGYIQHLDNSSIEYFAQRNEQLHMPMKRHKQRDCFLVQYPNNGFQKAAKMALKDSYKVLRRQKIKQVLLKTPIIGIILDKYLKEKYK